MRKQLIALLALALALAYAQYPNPSLPEEGDLDGQVEELFDVNASTANVKQKVRVIIPPRVALHLTEDEWQLNLNNPQAAPGPYTLNLQNPQPPAEGCYLVPKSVRTVAQLQAYLRGGGTLRPIGVYPAVADFNGDGRIDDNEKGTLLCVNQKVLQKFSNDPQGWQLTVNVTGSPITGFGYFGLADLVNNVPMGGFYTNTLPFTQVVAQGNGTTGGWLDDLIVEGFWFDGSEVEGTYNLTVTFTLVGL